MTFTAAETIPVGSAAAVSLTGRTNPSSADQALITVEVGSVRWFAHEGASASVGSGSGHVASAGATIELYGNDEIENFAATALTTSVLQVSHRQVAPIR